MKAQDKYVMLMSSLPRSERLFIANQPPLSRLKLERRLRILTDEDATTLRHVEHTLSWRNTTMTATDTALIEDAKRALAAIKSETLSDIVRYRLDMRTIIAALRRRHRGEAAPQRDTAWGFGSRAQHIARHWSEPGFRLDTVFVWVREAARLLEHDDTVGFERLILEHAHKNLQRHAGRHQFDVEAVVIYVLKWNIFDRWARAKVDIASERFDALMMSGLGSHAELTFDGEP